MTLRQYLKRQSIGFSLAGTPLIGVAALCGYYAKNNKWLAVAMFVLIAGDVLVHGALMRATKCLRCSTRLGAVAQKWRLKDTPPQRFCPNCKLGFDDPVVKG